MNWPLVAIQNNIRVRMTLAAIIVFAITFFCYRSALYNELVWDDVGYILKNKNITVINWENIKWMFTSFYMANWHPLTWLSLAIDYALVGIKPWGYHLTNIVLHSMNAVLVMILTVVLLRLRESRLLGASMLAVGLEGRILIAGFFAALLFGIHPQHVESVAWAAERKDVLSFFFTLLSILMYVSYAAKPQRHMGRYGLSLLFFALALLSKPMAVTTPVLLLLLDIYPLCRTPLVKEEIIDQAQISWWRVLLEKAPFFLLTLAVIVLTILAQEKALVGFGSRDIVIRLLNACNSVILYISKFLFPVNLHPLYLYTPVPGNIRDFIPALACILITLVCFYLFWKKYYDSLIIWLFYLTALSPAIGIIQVGLQSSADRYAYLPTLPFYMVAGVLISQLFNIRFNLSNWVGKASMVVLVTIMSIILYEKTQQQIAIWRSSLILWNYVVSSEPNNGRAQANMGRLEYLYGNYSKAIEHFRRADKLGMMAPFDFHIWTLSFLKIGNLEEAQQLIAVTALGGGANDYDEGFGDLREEMNAHLSIMNSQIKIGAYSCFYYNLACIFLYQKDIKRAQWILGLVTTDMPEYQKARDLEARIADGQLDHDGDEILSSSCQLCEHD